MRILSLYYAKAFSKKQSKASSYLKTQRTSQRQFSWNASKKRSKDFSKKAN